MNKEYDPIEGYRSGPRYDTRWFTFIVLFSQVFGLLSLILMAVWTASHLGGFAWILNATPGASEAVKKMENEAAEKMFNYHPLFMTVGLIFLYGDGILVYRVFRNERKIVTKLIHMSIQLAAIVFVIVALIAVFASHNVPGYPNLYSLHSWLGLITVCLFCLQFLLGFTFYLFPKMTQDLRACYMPVHIYCGVFIYGLATAVACLGINEKLFFLKGDQSYGNRPAVAWLGNLIGVFMLISCATTAWVVTKAEYKRQPLPEEETITLHSAGDIQ